ncbi:hypothetical protein C3L33_02256, partial [Rhododendron williamsianum]
MPYLVRENLFISNIGEAAEVLQNGSGEITHLLSVLSSASISFFTEWRSSISIPTKEIRKVYAGSLRPEDGSGDNSKSALSPESFCIRWNFIDQSRKEGGVLVHCFAGVSRSYHYAYLMKTEQLSQEDALEALRESCESVCPNDGFLEQLKMFEEMGFKVDHSSPIYKRFRLKLLGDSYSSGNKIDNSKFGADPGLPTEEVSSKVGTAVDAVKVSSPAYRCKKCRRVVAVQDNVVDHVPGEGETSFQWHKRRSGNPFNKWMRWSARLYLSSLYSKKVHQRGSLCVLIGRALGLLQLVRHPMQLRSWITPAFQLHKSRVDISTV